MAADYSLQQKIKKAVRKLFNPYNDTSNVIILRRKRKRSARKL